MFPSHRGDQRRRAHRSTEYLPSRIAIRCSKIDTKCRSKRSYRSRKLVSWCFEPSQPQRITSGLNTNFTQSPSYSFHKSSYHKSCFCTLFIFHWHSAQEPASRRVTYFILRAYTGLPCVSQSQHRRNWERIWKENAGKWTGRVEVSKEEIPGT